MNFYDLLKEAIEKNLPKDILLKFISHTNDMNNDFLKKERELKDIIKANFRTSYNLACVGQSSFSEKEIFNDNNIEENNQINVTVISDTAEYTLRELAETLQISYKTCAKRFKEMRVPRERRESRGSIYLGKTVKKSFQNQGN